MSNNQDEPELYWKRLAKQGVSFIPTTIHLCPFDELGFVIGIGVGSRLMPGFVFVCDGDDLSLQKSFPSRDDALAWVRDNRPTIIDWEWLTTNCFS